MMESLLSYAQENGAQGSGYSTMMFVIGAIGLWKMMEKAGEPGWVGIIPFYRTYKLCEKVMNDPWYWLRMFVVFIPIFGWILALYFKFQICKATAKAYGQPEAWAWGYLLIEPLFFCLTGFGKYEYYGPFGQHDHRTGEARQARSVDFDVIEQEPVTEQKAAAGESEVDFEFEPVEEVEFMEQAAE